VLVVVAGYQAFAGPSFVQLYYNYVLGILVSPIGTRGKQPTNPQVLLLCIWMGAGR
jgi:hypothetical protein